MVLPLALKFDLAPLIGIIDQARHHSPPYLKRQGLWGGWSITSSTGDVHDGWQSGERAYAKDSTAAEVIDSIRRAHLRPHTMPTPLYGEAIEAIVRTLGEHALQAARIRLALLKPGPEESSYWHQDAESTPQMFRLRLHIPLVTNPKCFFDYPNHRFHLPADGGAYILDVARKHRAVNLGDSDRYHLIMDLSRRD